MFCNLVIVWKFLDGDTVDVHGSPDPLSPFVKEGLARKTNVIHVYQNMKMFLMQVTPAGFTFAIWGVIFLWQGLWVAYAWSFLCRPNAYRTINTGVYIGFTAVNALNITWLFVWGYLHIIVASGVLFGLAKCALLPYHWFACG